LFPRGGHEPAIAPDHGPAQAIGIVLEILQRDRLRAQVAAAEGILLVAADRDDLPAGDRETQAAAGFAERADALHDARLRLDLSRRDGGCGRERHASLLERVARRVSLLDGDTIRPGAGASSHR